MSGFPFYILILLVNILQSPLNLSPSLGLSTPITNFRKEEFDHSVGSPDVFVQWRTLKVVICSVLGVGGGGPGYSQLSGKSTEALTDCVNMVVHGTSVLGQLPGPGSAIWRSRRGSLHCSSSAGRQRIVGQTRGIEVQNKILFMLYVTYNVCRMTYRITTCLASIN